MLGQSAPQSLALGQLGAVIVTSTDEEGTTGEFGRIYCLVTATFTTLTSTSLRTPAGSINLGGVFTLLPGMEIQGYFTAITLSAGQVIAYKI